MLSDEWLSRYGLLENFNASVTRTGTGTWTTGVTAIALCTSCSRAKNANDVNDTWLSDNFNLPYNLIQLFLQNILSQEIISLIYNTTFLIRLQLFHTNLITREFHSYMSRDARKPVFGVSDQVRHKPACTSSEKS